MPRTGPRNSQDAEAILRYAKKTIARQLAVRVLRVELESAEGGVARFAAVCHDLAKDEIFRLGGIEIGGRSRSLNWSLSGLGVEITERLETRRRAA